MITNFKFKAKRIDNNKWVYGSLLLSEIDVNEISVEAEIHERFANDFSISKHKVDPKTICRFLNIADRNGKEIYTNDIVMWGDLNNSSEAWHRYAKVNCDPDIQLEILFYIDSKTKEKKKTDNHIFNWGRFAYGGNDLKNIGNIFDNLELLG